MQSPFPTTTKADRKRARRAARKLTGHALTVELQRLTAVAAKRRKNQGNRAAGREHQG